MGAIYPMSIKEIARRQHESDDWKEEWIKSSGYLPELAEVEGQKVYVQQTNDWPRIIVPKCSRKYVFDVVHGPHHPGRKATSILIRKTHIWPNLDSDIAKWVRTCEKCQKNKITRHFRAPIRSLKEDLSSPLRLIHVDITGPYPRNESMSYILSIIDRATAFLMALPMCAATAKETVNIRERMDADFRCTGEDHNR